MSILSYSICKFTVPADEANIGEGVIEQGGLKPYLSLLHALNTTGILQKCQSVIQSDREGL